MIQDSTNMDLARRNLMILVTVLLLLTLTDTIISNFTLIDIEFKLANAPEGFQTFNELIFYLLTYFFIRYISIITDEDKYLTYLEDSKLFTKANERRIESLFYSDLEIRTSKKINGFRKGMKIGKIFDIIFRIFHEMFLNKQFMLFILPVVYHLSTVYYLYLKIELSTWLYVAFFFNVLGVIYFIIIPLIVIYFKNNKVLKRDTQRERKMKELKEKYKRFKESKNRQ